VVGALTFTITNPWAELLIFNLFGLSVINAFIFVGNWWDRKQNVKSLPKKAIVISTLLLAVPANLAAIIAIVKS